MVQTGHLTGVMTFGADKSMSGGWTNVLTSKGWGYEGQWDVVGGVSEMKIKSTRSWNYTPQLSTNGVDRARILHIDKQQMVFELSDDQGQTITWTRRK